MGSWPEPAPADAQEVARLLGRKPEGPFAVVARRMPGGTPAVISCWPFMGAQEPMPTLFWLLDPVLVREVSVVESQGAVREARAAVDPDVLAAAHARYGSLRDSLIPKGFSGARPSGGIGGTRQGVKCLHAHMAWHIVSGADPVIVWAMRRYPGAFSLEGVELGRFPSGLEAMERSSDSAVEG